MNRKRVIILTGAGLFYGLVLASLGLGIANGGDGAMIPLYIFGSPFFFPLLFLAPIVLWSAVGFLLSRTREPGFRKAVIVIMAVHYLGIVPYLVALGDWDYLSRAWGRSASSLIITFGWYAVGQAAIWIIFSEWVSLFQATADANNGMQRTRN